MGTSTSPSGCPSASSAACPVLEVSFPQSGRRLSSGAEGVSFTTATGVHSMNHSTSERSVLTRHCSACKYPTPNLVAPTKVKSCESAGQNSFAVY